MAASPTTRAWVGTFERSLDDKGRVVLPPVFRQRLAEGGVLSRDVDGCLALRTHEEFSSMIQRRMQELGPGEAARDFNRALSDHATDVTPDGQGRIMVPPQLLDYAGLDPKSEVVVSGAVSHVELWHPQRRGQVMARAAARLENPEQSGAVL